MPAANTAFTQELVFSKPKHFSNQENSILAERTLLLFPLLRKCEKRWATLPQNLVRIKSAAHLKINPRLKRKS